MKFPGNNEKGKTAHDGMAKVVINLIFDFFTFVVLWII